MSLASKIKGKHIAKSRKAPVWKGPEEDGITQSLLARFLSCRERFRLLVVEGLKPADHFEPRIEYGNMWHVCEEALASCGRFGQIDGELESSIFDQLANYGKQLAKRYPLDREKIDHWYQLCKAFFPRYVEYWQEHPDVKDRTPLMQEEVFYVPYKLPSGRVVRLRGKFDSVDLIGKGKTAGIYLQENKTKSTIDQVKLNRQLRFDLQTMFYLVALDWYTCQEGGKVLDVVPREVFANHVIAGVRYNVIRRPAHKSVDNAVKKFEEDKAAGRVGEWFARWRVEVSAKDVERFRKQCLDPILEQLCDWWRDSGWFNPFDKSNENHIHWRHPFGIYNPMDEGGCSDLDHYLETGDEIGLQRTDNLFPELEGGAK